MTLKSLNNSPRKNLLVALSLSALVSLPVGAAWAAGALTSLTAVFTLGAGNVPPDAWVGWLLIFAAGAGAGFATVRAGGRGAVRLVAASLAALCVVSLAASLLLHLDTLFAPMMLAAVGSLAVVQARRLWLFDAALSRNVGRAAAATSALEGAGAAERLEGGLRLLDAVLALEEASVFRAGREGALDLAARLRPASASDALSAQAEERNRTWREGLKLCARAVASGEVVVEGGGDAEAGRTAVAVPLVHEGAAVGALLVRLRGAFEAGDRPLLSNVAAQLARDLQREGARELRVPAARETFYSAAAARQRLEAFGVVSGLLTEQSFAARVLAESSEGHAVAYLDGTLACTNGAMLEAARLTAAEARALDLFGLLDCFRAGVFDEPAIAVRRVLQTGEPYERELSYAEPARTIALRIALVTTDEQSSNEQAKSPLCVSVTARDVTRIKEYERLKSDMLSLMSHELRTPITSINGFAELLVMDESLPAEAREFLTIINNESQRLARMINTFLSVAKLEQKDRQEVWMAPVMLDDVVRETVNIYQPVAKKKRIRLVEKDGVRLPPVAADRGMITRAVGNLVENAIKYSPERTAVMLSATLEADTVRLTVEDRGYGIPPEDVPRVWEKFYRVARDGHDKEDESTGLGLSYVREVVEQHGGTVSLDSEVGHGSRFSFTLPRL